MPYRWIAVCLVVLGCSTASPGEFTYAACSDRDDNDGDMLADCDDPDCQAFDHCTAHVMSPDAGAPPDAGSRDGGPQQRPDAGSGTDEDAGGDDDAGGVDAARPDAGAIPCGGSCGATQVCIDERCENPPPAVGRFTVTIVSVGVPDMNESARCFDDFCANPFPSPPFGFCTCPPDPYVLVVRIRGDVQTTVGRTATAIDERMPDFSDTPMMVELTLGDVLRVSVLDEDPSPPDQPMYECNLRDLPSEGRARCSYTIRRIEYAVEVELVPANAGN